MSSVARGKARVTSAATPVPEGQNARSAIYTIQADRRSVVLAKCTHYERLGETQQYPKKSQNVVRILKNVYFCSGVRSSS